MLILRIWLNQSQFRVTLRLAVYCQSVPLGCKPLEIHDPIFIFQLNTCGYSPYVTSSLMRGWVCLQLLPGLVSTVILRSESHRTHDHILLSQIWDSHNLDGQIPIFLSPRNRVAWLYPQALGSLFVASYNTRLWWRYMWNLCWFRWHGKWVLYQVRSPHLHRSVR
jgi:hypothetical protein